MKDLMDFKWLVFISAMFITGCAAVFSVSGIGKLFAGASFAAIVMASSLELGKIVSISFLYRYWNEISKSLKWYLMIASIVLMVVTSAGIYGYLTAAYATVAAEPLKLTTEMGTLSAQANTINADIDRQTTRLNQIIGLRTQQENRVDELIAKSTSGNTATIRNTQNQITQYDRDVKEIQNRISTLSTQRDSLLGIRSQREVEINTNSDIGTFVYIASIFNVQLDTIVKWFTLIIVLVFDPLAVALIIGFNFLVKRDSGVVATPVAGPPKTDLPPEVTPTPPVAESPAEYTPPVRIGGISS
jgi:hypothetical protein